MSKNYEILRLDWTPNPNAFKLILNQKVTAGAGLNFTDAIEAKDYELAAKILNIKDVESVFFKDDFITITQKPDGAMNEIHDQVVQLIEAEPVYPPDSLAASQKGKDVLQGVSDFNAKSDEEKLEIINQLLDHEIRPGLSMDGGGLDVLNFENNVLSIRYQGACGSCPSSVSGTLHYINQLLKNRLSPDLQVVSA